jgi:hypothetical protein
MFWREVFRGILIFDNFCKIDIWKSDIFFFRLIHVLNLIDILESSSLSDEMYGALLQVWMFSIIYGVEDLKLFQTRLRDSLSLKLSDIYLDGYN